MFFKKFLLFFAFGIIFAFSLCVSVLAASPTITVQPVDFYGQIGDTVTIFCRAEGEGLSYQWYVKDADKPNYSVSSIRIDTYTVTLNNVNNGRTLYCDISDSNNNVVRTNTVTMRVGNWPNGDVLVNSQPISRTVTVGDTVTFYSNGVGSTWLTYQWQRLTGNTWSDIVGQNTDTLSFIAQLSDNASQYRCLIRNGTSSSGETYSDPAVLTVYSRPFTNGEMFSILGQSNFTYIETLDSSYVYVDVEDYNGYLESSSNGLTFFYNYGTNVSWQQGSGTYYPLLISIPFNMGNISADDHYHLQFCFTSDSPGFSALPINYQVLAGSSVNKGNHTVSNGCSVNYSTSLSSVVENYKEWYFFNIDVRQLNSSSRFDYLYIFFFFNYGVSSSDAGNFYFGLTSNSNFGTSDIDSITSNILNISANLSEIQSSLSELNFNVNSVNSNVVLIYNLLRNSNTQAIVQQITNQLTEMITPSQEWVDIIEDLNEQYSEQETTLEALGDVLESLDKPDVEDVLADPADFMQSEYADVGLVTSVFSDVFNYGAFKWMALAVVALVTVSFVLFGKKR